jgi:hypothetical protein
MLLLCAGVLELGGYLYDHSAYDIPFPGFFIISANVTNVVAATCLLAVVAGMPLAIPNERVRKEDIVSLVAFVIRPYLRSTGSHHHD